MKYYGQFDRPVDQFLYERYFKYYSKPGVFIECGGGDGITESCCYFFEKNLSWSGVNVEASPHLFKKLQQNRPNSTNYNLALSNNEGEVNFTLTVHPTLGYMFGNNAIEHTVEHLEELKKQNVKFENVTVKTIKAVDLIKQAKIAKIELFILDVEGHELNVLEGLSGSLVLPQVFVIEFGHSNKSELEKMLSSFGYEFDFQYKNNNIYISNNCGPEIIRAINENDIFIKNEQYALQTKEHTDLMTQKLNNLMSELQQLKNQVAVIENRFSLRRALYGYFKSVLIKLGVLK